MPAFWEHGCSLSHWVLKLSKNETVLHRSRGGGKWRWEAPPAPVALCVISAWVSFPLGGPSLLTEAKIKKIGREGRDEQWPLCCSTRWGVTTRSAHTKWCGQRCWGSARPRGLLKRPFCAATQPGAIYCSPVSGSSGWINISVTWLTSQDPRSHPPSSSFAGEKTLTFRNTCFCGILSAVVYVH